MKGSGPTEHTHPSSPSPPSGSRKYPGTMPQKIALVTQLQSPLDGQPGAAQHVVSGRYDVSHAETCGSEG